MTRLIVQRDILFLSRVSFHCFVRLFLVAVVNCYNNGNGAGGGVAMVMSGWVELGQVGVTRGEYCLVPTS